MVLRVPTLAVIAVALAASPTHAQAREEGLFHEGLFKENTLGELAEALRVYREVLARAPALSPLAARAHLRIARCHEKMGDFVGARKAYEAAAAYPDEAGIRQIAWAALAALDRRLAQSAGSAAPAAATERDALARELRETRAALAARERERTETQGDMRALEQETKAHQARVAELEARLRQLDAAGADPAAALMRGLETRAALARQEVPGLLKEAEARLREGAFASARDAARRAQWCCRDLARVGSVDPDWEARAAALLADATLRQAEREWQARVAPARPLAVRVTLLAVARSRRPEASAQAGLAWPRSAAAAEPGWCGASLASVDAAALARLRTAAGVHAIPGGIQVLVAPSGEAVGLVGPGAGPACHVRLVTQRAADGTVHAHVLEAAAWTPAALPGPVGESPRVRVERIRLVLDLPPGEARVVAGLSSPFGTGEELLIVLEPIPPEEKR